MRLPVEMGTITSGPENDRNPRWFRPETRLWQLAPAAALLILSLIAVLRAL